MGQVLVRNLDDATISRLKQRAKRENTSLEQLVRNLLNEASRPDRSETIEAARRIRERIGHVSLDSTALIREDRDNDEPYR
jgi:plasmid stability protein